MPLKVTAISAALVLALAVPVAAEPSRTVIGPNGTVVHSTDVSPRPASHVHVVVKEPVRPVVRRTRCIEGERGNTMCTTRSGLVGDPKRVIVIRP